MQIVFLTQVTGFLKPFAWILGEILNAIYNFIGLIGIHNLALCIFLFTFVVKMLMLPLTIKQQKFSKLSSKINPEIKKIQEKYQGKKDEDSMRRQQNETQAVYRKYGASPMGGCLPLLISLPIMFALYRVIYAIPAYVTDIGDLYRTVANAVMGITDYGTSVLSAEGVVTSTGKGIELITQFLTDNTIAVTNTLASTAVTSPDHVNGLIDILAKFNPSNWDAFFNISEFSGLRVGLQTTVNDIISVNDMFGLNILDTPKWNSISVIIPILALATQFIQGKLQQATTSTQKKSDDPAASTSQAMMTIMPIMSGVFCLMLPIGVGIYWIASALFTIIQTFFINKYLDKTDIDALIEKNKAKEEKRNAKLGIEQGNKMAEVAKTKTVSRGNSYDSDYDNTSYKKNSGNRTKKAGQDYKRSNVSYKASSIAANAGLLSQNRDSAPVKPATSENSAEQTENK